MANKAAFLEVFPCCIDISSMCGGLEEAHLTSVEVTKNEGRMAIEAFFPRMPAPAELNLIKDKLSAFFGLSLVEIKSDYPRQAPKAAEKSAPAEEKKPWQKREYTGPKPLAADGDIIMGKPIKGEVTKMADITLESGTVIVKGKVFGTDSREVPKHDAAVLSFCLTDGTGSIHISRFIKNKSPDREAVEKIKDGMYICVSGVWLFLYLTKKTTNLKSVKVLHLKKVTRLL